MAKKKQKFVAGSFVKKNGVQTKRKGGHGKKKTDKKAQA